MPGLYIDLDHTGLLDVLASEGDRILVVQDRCLLPRSDPTVHITPADAVLAHRHVHKRAVALSDKREIFRACQRPESDGFHVTRDHVHHNRPGLLDVLAKESDRALVGERFYRSRRCDPAVHNTPANAVLAHRHVYQSAVTLKCE